MNYLESFEYNNKAFEALVLEDHLKSMIHSLVRIHANEKLKFDDLISSKGKGMIFLLHGEAGVGKTLTAGMLALSRRRERTRVDEDAESVADYTTKPLYTVSCGDLGVDAPAAERALTDILDLATHWNAVLLIDEADIFLKQRSPSDLQRNGLVSSKLIDLSSRERTEH